MGVTAAAHLPHVTSSTYPSLQAHLQASHQAIRVSSWSISIRLLRSTIEDDHSKGGAYEEVPAGAEGSKHGQGGRRAKSMYMVNISDYPDLIFVLVEDPERPTRTMIKNSKGEKLTRKMAESAEPPVTEVLKVQQQSVDQPMAQATSEQPVSGQLASELPATGQSIPGQLASEQSSSSSSKPANMNAPNNALQHRKDNAVILDAFSSSDHEGDMKNEVSTSADTSKKSATTRMTLFTTSSLFPTLLAKLNLPPPLGPPSLGDGVASQQHQSGPGAWSPRGAPLVVEGATWELPSVDGNISQYETREWKVRLGLITHGGTRGTGALLEAEYLPLLALSPNSPLLTSQLRSLFPPLLLSPPSYSEAPVDAISAAQPTQELWSEVVPASKSEWKARSDEGWVGKERGRRLAFLYISMLRGQGIL